MNGSTYRRIFSRIFMVLLLAYAVGAGLTATLQLDITAQAQSKGEVPGNAQGNASDAELWRKLRQGQPYSISDPRTGPRVVIQSQGETWRSLRNGPISTYGGYLLMAAVIATLAFFLIRGRVKIAGGRSGRALSRFSTTERVIHWYVASLFVLLGITGLIIMFGKIVLLPLLGKAAFSTLASASLWAHNLLGPLFILGIIAMFTVYVKDNIYKAADLTWILKGGIFFKTHVPSWKYNFGEKCWFWLAVVCGVLLSMSGILLDFPSLAESREQMQLANMVHSIAAIICVSASIAHIYLGTIGVEGALEGMTAGEVDENWAKEHHDLWAQEVMQGGESSGTPAGAAETSPAE